MPKFEFYEGNRIIATEDIPVHGVKKGDLGGLVFGEIRQQLIDPKTSELIYKEEEEALDLSKYFFNNAWIDYEATVHNTTMSENAIIRKNVKVMNSSLSGNTQVIGIDTKIEKFGKQYKSIISNCTLSENSIIRGYNKISDMKMTGDAVAEFVFSSGLSFQDYESMYYKIAGLEDTIYGEMYRIQSKKDIPSLGIKKNDLGGLISNMTDRVLEIPTLLDDSWVDYNSMLVESLLSENSHIVGEAIIEDSSIINSRVGGRMTLANSRVVSSSMLCYDKKRKFYTKQVFENREFQIINGEHTEKQLVKNKKFW